MLQSRDFNLREQLAIPLRQAPIAGAIHDVLFVSNIGQGDVVFFLRDINDDLDRAGPVIESVNERSLAAVTVFEPIQDCKIPFGHIVDDAPNFAAAFGNEEVGSGQCSRLADPFQFQLDSTPRALPVRFFRTETLIYGVPFHVQLNSS